MLVLSRKSGEAIHVGDNVFIKVIKTFNGQVRLGIVAPPDVAITRDEILDLAEPPQPQHFHAPFAAQFPSGSVPSHAR